MMWARVLMKIKIVFWWIHHPLISMLLKDLILIQEVIRDGPKGVFNSPRSKWGTLMARTPSHGYSRWSISLIYTRCQIYKNTIISWSILTEELIAYHDDVKSIFFFTQLINLRKKGVVIEHIQQFQKLSLRVEGILDDKLLDLFIRTLKDNIQHEVHLLEPTSLKGGKECWK